MGQAQAAEAFLRAFAWFLDNHMLVLGPVVAFFFVLNRKSKDKRFYEAASAMEPGELTQTALLARRVRRG